MSSSRHSHPNNSQRRSGHTGRSYDTLPPERRQTAYEDVRNYGMALRAQNDVRRSRTLEGFSSIESTLAEGGLSITQHSSPVGMASEQGQRHLSAPDTVGEISSGPNLISGSVMHQGSSGQGGFALGSNSSQRDRVESTDNSTAENRISSSAFTGNRQGRQGSELTEALTPPIEVDGGRAHANSALARRRRRSLSDAHRVRFVDSPPETPPPVSTEDAHVEFAAGPLVGAPIGTHIIETLRTELHERLPPANSEHDHRHEGQSTVGHHIPAMRSDAPRHPLRSSLPASGTPSQNTPAETTPRSTSPNTPTGPSPPHRPSRRSLRDPPVEPNPEDHALTREGAQIEGNARAGDDTRVEGNAQAGEDVRVEDNARAGEDAGVEDNILDGEDPPAGQDPVDFGEIADALLIMYISREGVAVVREAVREGAHVQAWEVPDSDESIAVIADSEEHWRAISEVCEIIVLPRGSLVRAVVAAAAKSPIYVALVPLAFAITGAALLWLYLAYGPFPSFSCRSVFKLVLRIVFFLPYLGVILLKLISYQVLNMLHLALGWVWSFLQKADATARRTARYLLRTSLEAVVTFLEQLRDPEVDGHAEL